MGPVKKLSWLTVPPWSQTLCFLIPTCQKLCCYMSPCPVWSLFMFLHVKKASLSTPHSYWCEVRCFASAFTQHEWLRDLFRFDNASSFFQTAGTGRLLTQAQRRAWEREREGGQVEFSSSFWGMSYYCLDWRCTPVTFVLLCLRFSSVHFPTSYSHGFLT